MRPTVICGFPGVGKSTFFAKAQELGLKVLDSDSSQFDRTNFPTNYIQHIKDSLASGHIVLCSTHSAVREALRASGIEYTIVMPKYFQCDAYLHRYSNRGSPESFINLMRSKWDEFWHSCYDDPAAHRIILDEDAHLAEVMSVFLEEDAMRMIVDLDAYLNSEYSVMIETAILRSEKGKRTQFNYHLRFDHIKERLGLTRLRQETVDKIRSFFTEMGATVHSHDRPHAVFVTIDLISATLNPAQAKMLADHWRA
jgi:adenylate kinase family enzyme